MIVKPLFSALPRGLLRIVVLAALPFGVAQALDAPYQPLGVEYQINSRPASGSGESNGAPAVARDPVGSFVATWFRFRDGGTGIFGRRYSAAGLPLGVEFRVDAGAGSADYYSDVGMDRTGQFTVVWSGAPGDGYGNRILARQFDALGVPKGPFSILEPDRTGGSSSPQIAMRESGDFVVVWEKADPASRFHVYAQRFGANGQALAPAFEIDFDSARTPLRPAVAINESGAFVIAWAGTSLVESESREIYLQRYDAQGQPVGAVIPVATVNADIQESPEVALQSDGRFLVTWTTWARESGVPDVVFQRFAADGSKLGTETQVNQSDWGNQRDSSVSMDADGRFVISWSSNGDPKGIFARWYDAEGNPVTGDTQVSSSGFGAEPAGTSVDADGDLIFVWTDVKQDSSGTYQNIRGRRYNGPEDVDLGAVLTAVSDTVSTGANIALELSVLNHHVGDVNAAVGTSTGVSVQLQFPPEAPLQSVGGDSWTCTDATSSSVRCTLNKVLAADAVAPKLQAVLKAPESQQKITPKVILSSQQFDSNSSNRSDQVSVSVKSGDRTPDAFSFPSQTGVARDVVVISSPVTISGIDVATPISVSSGSYYRIDNRAWTQTPGNVTNGAVVRVRHQSSAQALTNTTSTLTVGTVSASFLSKTVAADVDATPNAFSFPDKENVQRSTVVVWPAFTLGGTNGGAAIQVSGADGSYRVNNGEWTTLSSTVYPGDRIQVRHTTAAAPATRQTGTLRVGTASATFSSVTLPPDTTPDAFAFSSQTGVPMGSTRTSNTVTIGGIEAATPVSVVGGEYSLGCSGSFVSAAGSINPGQSVCVRHLASSSENTTTTTTLTVGGVSAAFSSTTLTVDTQPDAYDFVDQTRVARSTAITSNTVTVGGINTPASISVSGSGVSYSINGGAFTTAAGTVANGAQVRLRMTSSGSPNTKSTATVTIGGVSDSWSITTAPLI